MISVIIPVCNEEKNVGQLHAELLGVLRRLGEEFEIIALDDGSTDHTLRELKKLSPIKVISFTRNFGKSHALQMGFSEARGDVLLTMDGDLQDDPADIPRFLEAIQAADVVCGWRAKRLDPLGKRLISFVANVAVRRLAGSRVHDMNCGYKMYRKEIAKSIVLYGDMHRFIPPLAASMGYRVTEIRVHHRPRRHGVSKYGMGRLLRSTFDFLTLLFVNAFASRPMHFFGSFGGAVCAVGIGILLYLSYLRLFTDALIGGRPLLSLGILLVLVGMQFVAVGLLGELVIRQKLGEHPPTFIKERFEQ